jgi:hypothetical protein
VLGRLLPCMGALAKNLVAERGTTMTEDEPDMRLVHIYRGEFCCFVFVINFYCSLV